MLLTIDMKVACNDNEELSFIMLSAATENVIQWLEAEKPERGAGSTEQQSDKSDIEKAKHQRAEMERRVRDILAMEDRLRRKTI